MDLLYDSISSIQHSLEKYLQELMTFQRIAFLKGNDLTKASSLANAQIAFQKLLEEHNSLLSNYCYPELLHFLPDFDLTQSYEQLNFSSVPSYDPRGFDNCKLNHSMEKHIMNEFETTTAFLVKIKHTEKADVGHIYSIDYFRPQSMVFSGNFGASLCNNYDHILTKIINISYKILNVKLYKGYQMYFPEDTHSIFVMKDGNEVLTIGHKLLTESVEGIFNCSKAVISRDNFVYFISNHFEIVEIDWFKVIEFIDKGKPMLPGKKLVSFRSMLDIRIYRKSLILYMTTTGMMSILNIDDRKMVREELLTFAKLNREHDFTAFNTDGSFVVAASFDTIQKSNSLHLLKDTGTEFEMISTINFKAHSKRNYKREISKCFRIRNILHLQIDRLKFKDRGIFFLAICTSNTIYLLEASTELAILEEVSIVSEEESICLNGAVYLEKEYKVFLFGDFNFQQMLKLKL